MEHTSTRRIGLLILGVLALGAGVSTYWWLGSKTAPALPAETQGVKRIDRRSVYHRDLSKDSRVTEFIRWRRAGGDKSPDDLKYIDGFFFKVFDSLPHEVLLELIMQEFPPEVRQYYMDAVMKDASRHDPFAATKYLDLIPPGELLDRCMEIIASGAGSKGKGLDEVVAWINQLEFAENKETAFRSYLSAREWKGTSEGDLAATISRMPSDELKKMVGHKWLNAQPAGSLPAAEVAMILSQIQDPRAKAEIEAAIELRDTLARGDSTAKETDHPAQEDPQESAVRRNAKLRSMGVDAFSPTAADFGYQQLISGIEEETSKSGVDSALGGWFGTLAYRDAPSAVKAISEHSELQTDPMIALLSDRLFQVDHDKAKEWAVSQGASDPRVVTHVMDSWLRRDSQQASQWITSLPQGEVKTSATLQLVKWLKSKGEMQRAQQWEDSLPPK